MSEFNTKSPKSKSDKNKDEYSSEVSKIVLSIDNFLKQVDKKFKDHDYQDVIDMIYEYARCMLDAYFIGRQLKIVDKIEGSFKEQVPQGFRKKWDPKLQHYADKLMNTMYIPIALFEGLYEIIEKTPSSNKKEIISIINEQKLPDLKNFLKVLDEFLDPNKKNYSELKKYKLKKRYVNEFSELFDTCPESLMDEFLVDITESLINYRKRIIEAIEEQTQELVIEETPEEIAEEPEEDISEKLSRIEANTFNKKNKEPDVLKTPESLGLKPPKKSA